MQTSSIRTADPSPKILLIEDDLDQLRLMGRWLSPMGEVAYVDTGGEAARQLSRGEWDLVVSDIHLPGLDGLELVSHSKAGCPHAPVLLLTALTELQTVREAVRAGADELLFKPLTKDELVGHCRGLLAEGQARRREARRTVMAIGAHPDDVEIGCGGILAHHRKLGDEVVILTATGGEQGGEIGERVRESQRAADRLGAHLVVGSLRDTEISEGRETIAWIERAIDLHDPDVIYTHTPHDNHQDHRAIYRATVVAARRVPNLFRYQAPSTRIDFRPTRFVDIRDHMEEKLELLGEYRSQVSTRTYLTPEMIRSTATYWGRFAGYSLVEPLEVERSTDAVK
ncbi:MAG: PIG-L family deacetylase [Acidobacteriota bacterium]